MFENFRRTIIWGIAFIAGSIIASGALVYWLFLKLDGEAVKIALDRDTIHSNSQLIEGLANIKSTASETGKYKQALDTLLPAKDELVNFSGWLDGLSRARNVSESFSFQGNAVESSKSEAGYVGFSLDASGAYDNLIDFLKDVEFRAPRYLVGFDSFDIKRDGSGYRVSVRGKVFFR
ncbi:MAG: hypothetical protein HY433_02295 [Candidatus Liptonbacteria bacterium]|nr:hypothetical protein [Candidatus Liptonbacteria bacterium]